MNNAAAEIFQLRRDGRLAEALERARACHDATPDDLYVQRAYGWVLYSFLKKEADELEQQRMAPARFAERFPLWLAEFQAIGGHERPGLLYSSVMNQAARTQRAWSGFLEFAQWWDPRHLQADDRKPFTMADGKQAASLELRIFYAIGRDLVARAGDGDAPLLHWAQTQLREALERHPDDAWLNLYLSKWLLGQGEMVQARSRLAQVVRRQRSAAWGWDALGRTFTLQEPDRAIACWLHAVRLAARPQDVASTRIRLAGVLAQQQRFDEAAVQVHHAVAYRIGNGLRLPPALQQLAGSGWFRQRQDLSRLPAETDTAAEALWILTSLDERPVVYRLGVVDHQNGQKSLAHVAFGPDDGVTLHYDRHAGAEELPIGQILEVGQVQDERRPVCFRLSDADAIGGFCRRLSGEATQRDGQRFGFLISRQGERAFIPPLLMEQLPPDRASNAVQGVAAMSRDKQGKPGWRVLAWT